MILGLGKQLGESFLVGTEVVVAQNKSCQLLEVSNQ